MRLGLSKKLASMLLISSMVIGPMAMLSGCTKTSEEKKENKKQETVTLDVFSSLSSYAGLQEGWMAQVLKEKFNVKVNIVPNGDGVYQRRIEEGNLGDIVLLDKNSDDYSSAVKNDILLDWNKDDLLEKQGSYIKKNMLQALKANQELTATITDGKRDTLYGFAGEVAATSKDHDSFFYTWDVRWDIYKEMGYPGVNDLEDYGKLLKDMVKLCPKDDSGNKTYGMSLWSDWDDSMVMCVKSLASAYYGYDELGMGLYNPKTGKFYDALKKDGPYLEILKFYNKLYQDGLLDPASKKQKYDEVIKKVKKGSTLFSLFNYAGSLEYNKKKHLQAGKMMSSLKPANASPIVYSNMSLQGGSEVWSIGANTKYPERCMQLINWLATPEGRLTTSYGPRDLCWKYTSDKKTELTKLGKKCQENPLTKLGDGYEGSFMDGCSQILNVTWGQNATNLETDGETYNYKNWESNRIRGKSNIEKDWYKKTGAESVNDYFEKGNYTVSMETANEQSDKSPNLLATWKKVSDKLVSASWKAIYAKTDAQFDKIVNDMIKACNRCGYKDCVEWSVNEASKRNTLEEAIMK